MQEKHVWKHYWFSYCQTTAQKNAGSCLKRHVAKESRLLQVQHCSDGNRTSGTDGPAALKRWAISQECNRRGPSRHLSGRDEAGATATDAEGGSDGTHLCHLPVDEVQHAEPHEHLPRIQRHVLATSSLQGDCSYPLEILAEPMESGLGFSRLLLAHDPLPWQKQCTES